MFGLFGTKDTIDSAGNAIEKTGNVLDKLFTSDEERLTRQEAIERLRQKPLELAHELNLINAKDTSWFNSGWRPALGWVLAVSTAIYFIPKFFLATVLWFIHSWNAQAIADYPIDDSGLWQLASMMLGTAAIRSFEKIKGVARN